MAVEILLVSKHLR